VTRHGVGRAHVDPALGAWPVSGGVRFRVWAPEHARVEVSWTSQSAAGLHRLDRQQDGTHVGTVPGLAAGARYVYQLDGSGRWPDPASRFQPEGVHGPSEVVDPSTFTWTDRQWRGLAPTDLILYELHVGGFTGEGTFAGVERRLDHLHRLGVTALELMPIAEFAGRWNWGYDGVDLFAPSHRYGRPDDLRRLVNAAHQRGLAVFLDVVYNHLGPDGAYLGTFSPYYFTDRHHTPWGAALNLDGPHSERVREFFVENALHWVREYHLDGLRLDATHAIVDDSEPHLLKELAAAVHAATDRIVLVTAEDDRNLARIAAPVETGGYGLDALWADDFHHQVRRLTAGDQDGYFASYTGTTVDLARTVQQGWFFTGQIAAHSGRPRGTDPSSLGFEQFVVCIQNHDQIGNRAFGDRLTESVEPAVFRAASALLFCCPEAPLLFMGQEWGASTPFQYFTDHGVELGRLVTEGRRSEFAAFAAFADPARRAAIPDPQDPQTFLASRLDWEEVDTPRHQAMLRLYQALAAFRRATPALRARSRDSVTATALDDSTIAVWRHPAGVEPVAIVVRLRGSGVVRMPRAQPAFAAVTWVAQMTTEDAVFAADAVPPQVRQQTADELVLTFPRPAAVILRGQPAP
jgi:maltooligosyltrehalose trehalohydrolase